MSQEGAVPSITEANAAARAQLVSRLHRLWQSDPANYWKEFKASGLAAKDVWPNTLGDAKREMPRPETLTPPSKRKGAKKDTEE